ncbi:hypothetical protein, partial [Rhizobium leguminosarum]|uniref:hypothetical protein n=1 Tax=Rhizobium leguminosarum TaxID=384 RepID=UPI001C95FB1D
ACLVLLQYADDLFVCETIALHPLVLSMGQSLLQNGLFQRGKVRIDDVADEFELDEVVATERQLLYVAATRARDHLFVSAVTPGSEFLEDLIH